ncbi:HEPN domain-containing protein [Blautia sp. HCP3S3_G3]|uniref:HEPN domain-containing protein n=1 Tax=Blautia sp. HCP3S3_G3 TaxID=3438913 RepID=UPI003F8C69CD
MDNRQKELSIYRLQQSEESLKASRNCLENGFYKDSINRSYYSAFYAIKAVLALGTIDFKRHKDVIAYFNKEYVATEIFPRELGRRLGTLKQLREKSDYDDFYIASKEKGMEQIETAEIVLQSIKEYLAANIE